MEVDKNDLPVIHKAIDQWLADGRISPAQAHDLKQTTTTKSSDRQQIARYFFFIALFCTLLAFGALFLNEKLLEKLKVYFSWGNLAIALIAAILAAFWFSYTGRKKGRLSAAAYETYMVPGGLMALTSLLYLSREVSVMDTHLLFLASSVIVLGMLSLLLRSVALWVGALLSFVAWFGLYSIARSDNNLFLGMNEAVRYVVIAVFILLLSFGQSRIKLFRFTAIASYVLGLFLLFVSLWAMSVFGNSGSLDGWQQIRQVQELPFALLFAIATITGIVLGIRYHDDFTRDTSMLFLFINLYTCYFEFFWNAMNKGIFFLVLAITFAAIGWWLDRKRAGKKIAQQ